MFEALIIRFGYLAIGLGTFFEGEAILVAAGALAHRGLLSLPLVMFWAFVGSVGGDQLWFYLGRRFGRPLLERHAGWSARANKVQHTLERYGNAFVFGFRFIYGVRTVTPVLLGVSRYPAMKFAALNLGGAVVWAVVVGGAGWGLGAALASLLKRVVRVEEVLGVACVTGVVLWLACRRR
jgi:membrane protein DedA with SNARE-associated domain